MLRALVASLVLSTILAGASASLAQGVSPAPVTPPTQFALSADGEVSVTPDIVTLQLGVNATGRTAADALKANAQKMSAAIAALKAAGVAAKDIQTSRLSLGAQYAYEQGQTPRLTGYQAANSVSAVIRDTSKAGAVVDAVTQAGANEISGVSFDIADRHAAEDQARRAAVKALQAKAALYAEATGLHILRLASLSEGGGEVFQPQPVMLKAMAMRAESAPTPLEAGDLKVRISISGVYELVR